MAVHGTFRFHPIGQGLFYSGILMKKDGKQNRQFSFVYDCGTDSPRVFLRQETDHLKLLLKNSRTSGRKKLDLLIVSHLHDDHVNGLEHLLDGVEVDTVVMPYLSEGMKLLARLESSYDEAFLQSFYLDPVAWFESKGVRRILLLGADERDSFKDNYLIQRRESTNDLSVSPGSILMHEEYGETELVYLKNCTTLNATPFHWEFCLENLPVPNWDAYGRTVEEYLDQNYVTLSQVFASRRHVQALRQKLNRSVCKGGYSINRTSVVLLHNPNQEQSDTANLFHITPICDCYYARNKRCFSVRYTILTGDIELDNESISVFRKREDGGKCPPAHRTLVQYPHHGADADAFNGFLNDECFFVISCGITNRYGHPDSHIFQKYPMVEMVNERRPFDYEIFAE